MQPSATPIAKRTRSLTARFTDDAFNRVVTEANELGLTVNSFLNFAVHHYFRTQKGK